MLTIANQPLVAACKAFGPDISQALPGVDGTRLLLAIAGCESDFGRLREYVRAEPAYSPGGYYYKRSAAVRHLHNRWGCLAASSYGSFQILYVVATELGFGGHPIDLQNDRQCAYWATQLIVKRFIKAQGASSLTDVLDAYNSGTFRDQNIPVNYVEKGERFYGELQI